MIKILVSDKLSSDGLAILSNGGQFEVDYKPEITPEEIESTIEQYDALVIRSRTTVTSSIIAKANRLRVIGRAGVGVDNVDVPAATKKGIIVMNTPDGNTISTAEHTFTMLCALARSIPQAVQSMREGRWDKKKIVGVELYNKVLGIVGLGRIGGNVAKKALAFGMRVIAYDPFISDDAARRLGVTLATVNEICSKADFITVHTPLNDATRNIISTDQFNLMKPTVRVVNCARGGIINEDALCKALETGKIAGAAIDVFTKEPLDPNSPLRKFPNVNLTPHLGAATTEAQEGVARDIANQIVEMLRGEMIHNAVNAPTTDPAVLEKISPYIDLARKMGRFLSQYVTSRVCELRLNYSGTILEYPTKPISSGALVGLLETNTEGAVNFVNAHVIAKERGVELVEKTSSKLYDLSSLVTLTVITEDNQKVSLGGSVVFGKQPRIVSMNEKFFDIRPEGILLVIENHDVPGVVGQVGTLFGKYHVNIDQMTWGKDESSDKAITVINADSEVPSGLIDELVENSNIISAHIIIL